MKTASAIVGWIVLLVGALGAWAQDPSPDPVAAPAASAASGAPATPAGQDGEMAPEGPPQEPSDSGAVPAPTKPPANPYQGVFYDNDFSFLDGPSTAERHFGYSHLWPGAFLFDTPGGAGGRDFYYTQFTATF